MKRQTRIPGYISVLLALVLLFSACSPAATTSIAPSEAPAAAQEDPTSTPSPTATETIAPTATLTPSPTITPTPTPSGLLPGLYQDANGCTDIIVGQPPKTITWCVASVEVTDEGNLIFTVTWTMTALVDSHAWVIKRSDVGNTKMYIKDQLGRTYDHISVGGDAAIDLLMYRGDTALGWFIFPPPKEDARSFTFYDNNNQKTIGPLTLTNRTILFEKTILTWHPLLQLRYRVANWTLQTADTGGMSLAHTKIPGCQIVELNSKEPQGRFKYPVELGAITYNLYARYDDATHSSIREYLVTSGLEDMSNPPMFEAILPDEGVMECSADVAEALEGLLPVVP